MDPKNLKKKKNLDELDEMIAEITVDAYGDNEQLWAFRQAFEDDVALPADGFVNGEPVSVIADLFMELCREDLRCLDAHSHLCNFVFDHHPQDAIRHYEVGLRIGELPLGGDFTGVLPWRQSKDHLGG